MGSRDTEGSCSVAAEGGRYATLPSRRQMLMESLGDELIAKDLIDNALVTDESKRVSLAQEMTHTILNSYYILKIFIWCERRSIGRQFEGEHGRVFHLNDCFDPRDIRGEYDKDSHGKTISLTGRETGAILVAGMG